MNTLTEHSTVGEIVAQHPAAARIFENYGIDYCCGGGSSLADACHSRGLMALTVIEELSRAGAAPDGASDWQQASLDELIDHILSRHHVYLKTELPRLEQALAKVIRAHGAAHGRMLGLLEDCFVALQDELLPHMMKEEMVLFPLIRELEASSLAGRTPERFGSIQNPIQVMQYEHDSAGRTLEQMRHITCNYELPPDACNTWRVLYAGFQELEADLHQHIHLENNILFPRASR